MGRSGVAMLRLSGPDSLAIAQRMLPHVRNWEHSRAQVGKVYSGSGELIDQVVLTTFISPKSFTGEDTVEFSCHGNPLIIDAILNLAIQHGARLARGGEFTRQALLNGKLSLLKAEALNELIHATSLEGIEIAHRGLQGSVDDGEEHLRSQLINIAAELEAKMDYPQEDLSFETDEEVVEALQQIAVDARKAADSYQQNRIRLQGAKVVILGPVNAGKSSLFNNLVGSKRAIVSERPGTTRDIVERRVLIDGMEICFFDTAGARFDSDDPIENEGIQMGIELAQEADLCLLISPVHQELGVISDLLHQLGHIPFIRVGTHADVSEVRLFEADCIVSNIDGMGILELKNKIRTMLGFNKTTEAKWVSLSQRQAGLFYQIAEHVELAAEALVGFLGPAVATEEITIALEELALLRGGDAREQVLDRLFANFCVGK